MREVIPDFKQPMLAPSYSPLTYPKFLEEIEYPVLLSPKVDGIRNIVKHAERMDFDSDLNPISLGFHNVCFSKSLTRLPSRQVQESFSGFLELDGELTVGPETDTDLCNRTQSYVMSDDKPAENLAFRVFDCADTNLKDEDFELRLEHARGLIDEYRLVYPDSNVSIIEHEWCDNLDDLLIAEERWLAMGYEGVMGRNPFGRYKQGRGTWREKLNFKLKRFEDTEGVLVGLEEGSTNTNPDMRNNMGFAKRSFAKDGLFPSGMVGVLIVNVDGMIARVAPGELKHPERVDMLKNPERYLQRTLTFRHFPHGAKDTFRQAKFANWRDKRTM